MVKPILTALLVLATLPIPAQQPESEQAQLHRTPEWALIAAHLPDPATATPAQLEAAADVLRARRFPYDALDLYHAALTHAGLADAPRLMNRLGMVELELRHPALARVWFLHAAALQPKNPQFWNNAGAADFIAANPRSALANYNKASKLDKHNAIYHSNLATAYFELKDYESARKHFAAAFKLDPALYQHKDGSGIEARVFSSTDHGRFCFELARVSAHGHDDPGVLAWLGKATDSNFDIQAAMNEDRAFDPYRKDPRVLTLIQNARALRATHTLATVIPPLSNIPVTP